MKTKNMYCKPQVMGLDNFMNQWFNQVWDNDNAYFTPRTDVIEHQDRYEIQVSVPGIKKEDITLETKENFLTIKGERKQSKVENAKYHTQEIHYGSFSRTFRLPKNVLKENISARYEEGMLIVTLGKTTEQEPVKHTITIE